MRDKQEYRRFPIECLKEFSAKIFMHFGVPETDAMQAADVLAGPLIPGDPEREAEAIRSQEGVPLLKPVVDGLLDLSKKTRVPFD
jgi:LDH2 family malate/lactate/ureidoglycolate dehydrogenase